MTLLNRVVQIGQGAGDMGRRAVQAPGNLLNRGLDKLQDSTYRHLMSNAGQRAEDIASEIYMSPNFKAPDVPNYSPNELMRLGMNEESASRAVKDFGQIGRENRQSVFNNLYDNEYAKLADRASSQAALVPGGMRAVGRAAKSPLAMTAYGVGGTLGVGNMLEDRGQQAQLVAMGLSPEEAEILANEVAMAAQNMEPLSVF